MASKIKGIPILKGIVAIEFVKQAKARKAISNSINFSIEKDICDKILHKSLTH